MELQGSLLRIQSVHMTCLVGGTYYTDLQNGRLIMCEAEFGSKIPGGNGTEVITPGPSSNTLYPPPPAARAHTHTCTHTPKLPSKKQPVARRQQSCL